MACGYAEVRSVVERINRYLDSGKTALAHKMVEELMRFPDSIEILARIRALSSSQAREPEGG